VMKPWRRILHPVNANLVSRPRKGVSPDGVP
jgi:hypothetical protein